MNKIVDWTNDIQIRELEKISEKITQNIAQNDKNMKNMKQIIFKDFIHLFEGGERVREHAQTRGGARGEREADSPLGRKPDAGFDPKVDT